MNRMENVICISSGGDRNFRETRKTDPCHDVVVTDQSLPFLAKILQRLGGLICTIP